MRLVYKDSGTEVKVGDTVRVGNLPCRVEYFRRPSSPASSGKVTVRRAGCESYSEYFVGVIGAEWIEREDRG